MTRNRQASDAGDPLLHEAQRLIVEAEGFAGAAAPDDPNFKARLAALIAELGDVRQAMTEKCDATRQQTDLVVRQMAVTSAYHRVAKTLSNGRKRP
jgi:hypothetical protein